MWSRQHTLAEFRVFTCLNEEESLESKVHAYVTRALIRYLSFFLIEI